MLRTARSEGLRRSDGLLLRLRLRGGLRDARRERAGGSYKMAYIVRLHLAAHQRWLSRDLHELYLCNCLLRDLSLFRSNFSIFQFRV